MENGEELSLCRVGLAQWAEERVVIIVVADVGRRMVFGSKERREQMRKREGREREENRNNEREEREISGKV